MGGGTGFFQGQQLPEAAPPDSSMWPCEWGGAGQQYSVPIFSAFHAWSPSLQPQSLDFPPRAITLAGAEVC